MANGGSYWIIDANLQLWLDEAGHQTKGGLTHYSVAPKAALKVHEKVNNKTLDAQFDFVGSRKIVIQGWVESSKGRVETTVQGSFEYHNGQTYQNDTNICKFFLTLFFLLKNLPSSLAQTHYVLRILLATWTQRASENIEVKTKTTQAQNDVTVLKHHPHPKTVTTTDVSQNTASSCH